MATSPSITMSLAIPRARARPLRLSVTHTLLRHRRQRGFSTFGLSDTFAWSAELVNSVHQAGVPWYLTLPLAAVGVNFAVRLPIAYQNRTLSNERTKLQPLVAAWRTRVLMGSMRENQTTGVDSLSTRISSWRAYGRNQRRIFKSFGVQRWKTLSTIPLNMLPFIIMSGGIRHLCQAPAAVDPAVGAHAVWNSLTHGGGLWFVDLTASDPYLPWICTAVLYASLFGRFTFKELRALFFDDSQASAAPGSDLVGRAMQRLVFAMPLIPLWFSGAPAAMFLYWLTTFSLSPINDMILNRLLPRPPPFVPLGKQRVAGKINVAFLRGPK